jgi:hypothetical protein
MLSRVQPRLVLSACVIFLIVNAFQINMGTSAPAPLSGKGMVNAADEWREASLVRVLIDSTSDWGRILFDDRNGTNSNGIRIRSVLDSGWIEGRDADDVLYAGRDIAWPDTEYDRVVVRKGDIVEFFKGLGDFHSTEVYADLVLEVNIDLPQLYVWLMTGGNGRTTFAIVSNETGGTIWQDVVIGAGDTVEVKRVMSAQPFFRPGRTESTIVFEWLLIAILVMMILNFPVLETLTKWLRSMRQTGTKRSRIEHGENEGTGQGATERW